MSFGKKQSRFAYYIYIYIYQVREDSLKSLMRTNDVVDYFLEIIPMYFARNSHVYLTLKRPGIAEINICILNARDYATVMAR